ncbi:MAG: flagellar basal-body MS-ring/collar protein FliF [Armatimonadota bacterium]
MEQIMKFGPLQAIVKFWERLSGTQRFVTVVFVSLSIVLLVVVSVVATRPKMSVLFSGLESEDAGTVVSKLQEKGVPYEVEGSSIKIPEKYVAETRMELASQGLPRGGNVGFELFDKSSLGMTEFSQKLNFQRALQGELARSIDQLDGVQQSKVLLALPESKLFQREEKEPSASVIVKLRPGSELGNQQIGGIVHLVSSAVEGLKPEHVTVVDTSGNMLSECGDETTGLDPRLSASQLQLQRQHERQVEKNIQSMLEPILGPNKSIVRVNAQINFDRTETDRETYEPARAGGGSGVLSSEVRLQEVYGGSQAVPIIAAKAGYQRTETTSKYEVSKVKEHIVRAPGQVEKLSVAVMVDSTAGAGKLSAIRDVVKTATGIEDVAQITVESVEFDNSAAEAEAKEMKSLAARAAYLGIGKTVGAAVLILVVIFFLKNMLGQIKIAIPETVRQEASLREIAMAPAYGPSGQDGGIPPPSMPQVQPEEVAQVLRKWISEN